MKTSWRNGVFAFNAAVVPGWMTRWLTAGVQDRTGELVITVSAEKARIQRLEQQAAKLDTVLTELQKVTDYTECGG